MKKGRPRTSRSPPHSMSVYFPEKIRGIINLAEKQRKAEGYHSVSDMMRADLAKKLLQNGLVPSGLEKELVKEGLLKKRKRKANPQ